MMCKYFKLVSIHFILNLFLSLLVLSQSKYSKDPSVRRSNRYKLRSGDVLSLYVLGKETKIEVTLDADGIIKPVYLKELKVSGLSLKEIEKKLSYEYKNQLIYNNLVKAHIKQYTESGFIFRVQ